MKGNLDVLVSFVVILIALSVLLQIIVDAFKNFLRLRWRLYEIFLRDAYRERFAENGAGGENAIKRAWNSFSALCLQRKSRKRIGSVGRRFKTLEKGVVSAVDNMSRIRKTLLETKILFSTGTDEAILKYMLTLPRRLGLPLSGLRSVDFESLLDIYWGKIKVELSKGKGDGILSKFRTALEKIDSKLIKLISDPEILKADSKNSVIELVVDEILSGMEELERKVGEYKRRFIDHVDDLLGDLENRYERSVAAWTFFLGILLAFGLNADSVLIYKTLKMEPAIREAVMAQSNRLTENITMPDHGQALNDLASDANKIRDALDKDSASAAEAYEAFIPKFRALAGAMAEDAASYLLPEGPDESSIVLPFALASEEGPMANSLKKYLEKLKSDRALSQEDKARISALLDSAVSRLSRNYAALASGIMRGQISMLQGTELPLGWSRERFLEIWSGEGICQDILELAKKIVGLLGTAVLISFGAPFWNNILKSLLGLRGYLRQPRQPV